MAYQSLTQKQQSKYIPLSKGGVQEQPKESLIGGFAKGAGKGLLSTISGAAGLGEKIVRSTTQALLPKSIEEKIGITTPTRPLVSEKYTTPTTTAQKAGFVTEQVAEFVAPIGAVAKLPKILTGKKYLRALEVINPILKGKQAEEAIKAGRAYKTAIKGEVKIAPNQQQKELAQSLSNIIKSKDPIKNIKSLNSELSNTEKKLIANLKKDTTPIIKKAVGDNLDVLKENIPLGFRSIEAETNQYNNAIDLFKSILGKEKSNIEGLRNARILFDKQFKTQFPNAIKNGVIDTKSAAGVAYKAVRDNINDYLYSTAKEGSTIKNLIKKEADILRAKDYIAPKIREMIGTKRTGRFFERHPGIKKAGYITGGAAVGATGIGLLK